MFVFNYNIVTGFSYYFDDKILVKNFFTKISVQEIENNRSKVYKYIFI